MVALDTTKTPMTANNFIVLARYHYYDGTAMFRTDTSIDIIQGGSPHTQDASIRGRATPSRTRARASSTRSGDLTMARTSAAQQRRRPVLLLRRRVVLPAQQPGHLRHLRRRHQRAQAVLEKILALNVNTSNGLGRRPEPVSSWSRR